MGYRGVRRSGPTMSRNVPLLSRSSHLLGAVPRPRLTRDVLRFCGGFLRSGSAWESNPPENTA